MGALRLQVFELLQRDRELREVAGLVGPDALEDRDRLVLESARLARELLVAQSAYDPADATSPITKTHTLADLVIRFHRSAEGAIAAGRAFGSIDVSGARRAIAGIRSKADGGSAEERAQAIREVTTE